MPCAIVIGGAPGCGKPTLAAGLLAREVRVRLRAVGKRFGSVKPGQNNPEVSDGFVLHN
jgi:cytidylate kinase